MERHRQVSRVGEHGNLLGLEQAANLDGIGLDDVRAPLGEKQRNLVARIAAFADGDLESRRAGHLAKRDIVLRIDRLLEPVGAGLGELMGKPARRADAEASMAVDEHLNVSAYRRAHRGDILDSTPKLGATGIASQAPERIELQGAIARCGHGAGGGACACAGLRVMPAVGVGRNFGMHAPAEQVEDRLPQGFAADVPQGELDRRYRAVEDRTAARILVAIHGLNEALDLKRRGAEHITGGHVVDGCGDGARLPLHCALAEPAEPCIRVHTGENEIVPPMADQEHFDAGDLHALPPASACARRWDRGI